MDRGRWFNAGGWCGSGLRLNASCRCDNGLRPRRWGRGDDGLNAGCGRRLASRRRFSPNRGFATGSGDLLCGFWFSPRSRRCSRATERDCPCRTAQDAAEKTAGNRRVLQFLLDLGAKLRNLFRVSLQDFEGLLTAFGQGFRCARLDTATDECAEPASGLCRGETGNATKNRSQGQRVESRLSQSRAARCSKRGLLKRSAFFHLPLDVVAGERPCTHRRRTSSRRCCRRKAACRSKANSASSAAQSKTADAAAHLQKHLRGRLTEAFIEVTAELVCAVYVFKAAGLGLIASSNVSLPLFCSTQIFPRRFFCTKGLGATSNDCFGSAFQAFDTGSKRRDPWTTAL